MKKNIFYRENNSIKGFYSSRADCYNLLNSFSIKQLTALYYHLTIKSQDLTYCFTLYKKSRI